MTPKKQSKSMTNDFLKQFNEMTEQEFDEESFARFYPATERAWELTRVEIKSFILHRHSLLLEAYKKEVRERIEKDRLDERQKTLVSEDWWDAWNDCTDNALSLLSPNEDTKSL